MVFDHVGIMNEDKDRAIRFYQGILGLEMIKESSASPELARQLFSLDQEIRMLVFGKEDLKVEIFIIRGLSLPSPSVPHFCLQVPDLGALLEKAKKEGAKLISAERAGRTVHFIEDFSGNRIELKPLV
jgi:catechol 2,3-dioxygenase-like lactoylglutathione lyase family enzyme